ncbi:MAG: nitrogen regulation protein NR(II) [Isosphaeraceae bacterium]
MADLFVSPRTTDEELRGSPDDRSPRSESAEFEPERLRAQYAEIAQLAGGLAHEIRNPLSTLSLNLDMLAEDFADAESPRDRRALQRVQRLRREAQRLQDILENFLRFAKAQQLREESADLNAVVEELRDFFEPQVLSQGISIRTFLDPNLPPMRLDVDLFRQALLNLLINARQALPEGGEILLRTRDDGEDVVLEVTDTGVGMSKEVLAKVFDPFYSTRPGGSGLGLPTIRKIVEAHGGRVQVASEPGRGSQFMIRLPKDRQDAQGARIDQDSG